MHSAFVVPTGLSPGRAFSSAGRLRVAAVGALGWALPCWGHPAPCRAFRGMPGLQPLEASRDPTVVRPKNVSSRCHLSWGICGQQNPRLENKCYERLPPAPDSNQVLIKGHFAEFGRITRARRRSTCRLQNPCGQRAPFQLCVDGAGRSPPGPRRLGSRRRFGHALH